MPMYFKGAFIAARVGEATLRQSKAAINRTWQTFLHQGTTHSARAETLLDIINRCEREGVPYNLKAYPGHGYSIIALPPLPKEKIHA